MLAETLRYHNALCRCGILVSRISLVSPQRSQQIESILLRMAQSGQLRGRVSLYMFMLGLLVLNLADQVSEAQLIELLEQVGPR